MVTLVKLSQPENAYSPINVTEEDMVTLVKLSQPENATYSIDVTEEGITYVPFLPCGYLIKVCIFLSKRTPSMLA
jgi:hypothetical protein